MAFGPHFNYSIFCWTLVTTLFLQILSNLANDYGDYKKGTDNKERIGPERALQSGAITKKEMFTGIVITGLLSFLSGLYLLYISFGDEEFLSALLWLGIGVMCIVAAIKYTMGKKAYGYYALGDVAVFVFFGIVGVFGSYYLQERYMNKIVFLVASAYGLWCTAVLNLNNMRDVENDIKFNKKTTAYLLGFEGAKFYHSALIIVPYALIAIALTQPFYSSTYLLFTAIPLSFIQLLAIIKTEDRIEFDKWLKFQSITTFLNAVLLFLFIYLMYA